MPYEYGLSEGVVLRADPEDFSTLVGWIGGRWKHYVGISKDWIERLPITEAEAKDLLESGDSTALRSRLLGRPHKEGGP